MTVHQRPFAPADAVRLEATHPAVPLSPIRAALARLEATEAAFAEVRRRRPDHDHPERDAAERADDAAFNAIFAAPITTREDALVFLDFMLATTDPDPAADGIAAATHMLKRALAGEFQTTAVSAEGSPQVGAEVALGPDGLPGLDAIATAWDRLPPDAQREIGVQAATFALYGRIADDMGYPRADQWFPAEVASQAEHEEEQARLRLADVAASALPELFGAEGEKPAWAETTAVPATATTGPEV